MLRYALLSLCRQRRRYVRLWRLLVAGMVAPLMLSVLGSSSVYGDLRQKEALRQGADFQIVDAPASLAAPLEALGRFEVTFGAGGCYLRSLSPLTGEGDILACTLAIQQVLDQAGLSTLLVHDYTQLTGVDPSTRQFQGRLRLLAGLLTALALLLFHTGYRAFGVSKKWRLPLFRGGKFGQPEVVRICMELILQAKSTTRPGGKAAGYE